MEKTFRWFNKKTGHTLELSEDLVLKAAVRYVELGWNKLGLIKELKFIWKVENYISVSAAAIELAEDT